MNNQIESVLTHNVLVSLEDDRVERVLQRLMVRQPALVALQEWGAERAELLKPYAHWEWAHPGAMPIGVRKDVGRIRDHQRLILAPGTKDVRTTWATEAQVVTTNGHHHAVLNVHLLAHLDRPANRAAWEASVEAIEDWVAQWRGRARPWVMGDVNFHELELKGVRPSWHPDLRQRKPTFGPRIIDGIWTEDRPKKSVVVQTASDHRAVYARYGR